MKIKVFGEVSEVETILFIKQGVFYKVKSKYTPMGYELVSVDNAEVVDE